MNSSFRRPPGSSGDLNLQHHQARIATIHAMAHRPLGSPRVSLPLLSAGEERPATITGVKDGLAKIREWFIPFGGNRREAIEALEYLVAVADPKHLNPVTRSQALPIPEPPSWLGNAMDGIKYEDLAGTMTTAVNFLKGEKRQDTCLRVVALMASLPATPKELTDAANILMEKYPGMDIFSGAESEVRDTLINLAERLTNPRSFALAELTEPGAFRFNSTAISELLSRRPIVTTDSHLTSALIGLAAAGGDISLVAPLEKLTAIFREQVEEKTRGKAVLIGGRWQHIGDGGRLSPELPFESLMLLRMAFDAIGTLLATELAKKGRVEFPIPKIADGAIMSVQMGE